MDDRLFMLGMILLMLAFAVVLVGVIMIVLGGLGAGELKDRVVLAALRTYTLEGEPIPDVRPGLVARFILWLAYRGRRPPALIVDAGKRPSPSDAA